MKLENSPDLWLTNFPRPKIDGHKYHRGHAAIFAAPELTGATRLAASACNRVGAGLVTVVASGKADIYRSTLPADIMVRENLPDKVNVVLAGSGGISARSLVTLTKSLHLLERCVLDADLLQTEILAKLRRGVQF